MTAPEPYVKTWSQVNFDDASADAAITAIDSAATALGANDTERWRWRPTDDDWGGPHRDEFVLQYAALDGQRDTILQDMADARARLVTAKEEAATERSLREAEWNDWWHWYDYELTPEERAVRTRRQTYEPSDVVYPQRAGMPY